MKKWLILLVAIIVVVAIVASGYNSLVQMSESINGNWSQIENQLQRRADLIPNLVETVKGYAAHESEVFAQVTEARSKLIGAGSVAETSEADQAMTSALSRLLAIAEAYPQLKADANFRALQDELAGTENRIATARMDYNKAVQAYNAKIRTFPTVIYAGAFGFEARDYFEADEGVEKTPEVNFSK